MDALTPIELRTLKGILASTTKRAALLAMIDEAMRRYFELPSASIERDAALLAEGISGPSRAGDPASDNKRVLVMLLSDRDALPATKDVVKTVNAAFKYRFNAADYSKKGREPLIERCWQRMELMDPAEQQEVITRIISLLPNVSGENNEYQRLFRFLTRNER